MFNFKEKALEDKMESNKKEDKPVEESKSSQLQQSSSVFGGKQTFGQLPSSAKPAFNFGFKPSQTAAFGKHPDSNLRSVLRATPQVGGFNAAGSSTPNISWPSQFLVTTANTASTNVTSPVFSFGTLSKTSQTGGQEKTSSKATVDFKESKSVAQFQQSGPLFGFGTFATKDVVDQKLEQGDTASKVATTSDGPTDDHVSPLHRSGPKLFARALANLEKEKAPDQKERLVSAEAIKSYKTILCKDVPEQFNNRVTLKDHFSKYGVVKKVIANPKRGYATVQFEMHDSAAVAKRRGAIMGGGDCPPLKIYWTSRRSSEDGKEIKKEKSEQKPKLEVYKTFGATKEITSELAAMAEVGEYEPFSERPSESALQEVPKPTLQITPEHLSIKPAALLGSQKVSRPLEKEKRLNKDVRVQSLALQKPKVKSSTRNSSPASQKASGKTKDKTAGLDLGSKAIFQKVSKTNSERLEVLEARDKVLRSSLQKQFDIHTAKATVGTCPDMCPEKERYGRADKVCVSSFELIPGTSVVDPRRMVKEYSRSSADQDEPLPHELRPPPVLKMTMDYLVCNVLDAVENPPVNVSDWYDFIWNRTRAIRKDITQQHLGDLVCVGLVEKCARFHIHCAATLVEENISVFDPKINDEHLTKCLQTLKYMYYDLSVKNIACPNEAEFMSYDALLHLNEGDFLRHSLSRNRNTPELKFALQTYHALTCNNYVKFFRLVKDAPYFQACILHRYFNQVRVLALCTIIKGFCPPNHKERYFLQELMKPLGFETIAQVKYFCSEFGLETDDNTVILHRAYRMPSSSDLPKFRPKLLIEAKRTCSIGQIINNEPLPENPLQTYHPHDSFTSDGILQKNAMEASDQAAKSKMLKWPSGQPEPSEQFKIFTEKLIEDLCYVLLTSLIEKCVTSVAQQVWSEQVIDDLSRGLLNEVLEESVTEECFQIHSKYLELHYQEKLAAKIRQKQREEQFPIMLYTSTMEDVTQNLAFKISKEVIKEERIEFHAIVAEKIAPNVLDAVLHNSVERIVQEVYHDEMIVYNRNILAADTYRKTYLLRSAFSQWKKVCEKSKQYKLGCETFPSCPSLSFDIFDPSLKFLVKRPRPSVKSMVDTCSGLSKEMDALLLTRFLQASSEWSPVKLNKMLSDSLFHLRNSKFPWKLILSVPEWHYDKNFSHHTLIKKLYAQFGLTTSEDNQYEQIHTSTYSDPSVSYCIKGISGELSDRYIMENLKSLYGTSGILFIFPVHSETDITSQVACAKSRLYSLFKFPKLNPPPVVYVLTVSCTEIDESQVVESLNVKSLHQKGYLHSFAIRSLNSESLHSIKRKEVLNAIRWILQTMPNPPPLKTSFLRDFIEEGMIKLMFTPVCQGTDEVKHHGSYWQPAHEMLQFYNDAIEHLASTISSCTLVGFTVPPLEVPVPSYVNHWNDPGYLLKLYELVQTLKLPVLPSVTEDVEGVWEYIKILKEHFHTDVSVLVSSVEYLLRNALEVLPDVPKVKKEQKAHNVPHCIPWIDVIQDCFHHVLSMTSFEDQDSGQEYVVHYLKEELDSFETPSYWFDVMRWPHNLPPHVFSLSSECKY